MSEATPKVRPPIAVVGVSALFPGSTDAGGFWSDILAGKDLLTDVPASHWLPEDYYDPDPTAPDKTYARRGGFLNKVDFDALSWGVPPSIIPATDTSQLLALIVAESVLRDAAGADFETMDRSRISVILGVTSAQELLATMVSRLQRPIWVKSLREHGLAESEVQAVCERIADHYQPWQESSFPGLLGNVVAGRIANRLDLGGTNCVTDAACASTFSALSMAVNELYLGDSDMVIAGGVDTLNDIFMFMCFSKTPALSMTGDIRPFSDQADGTMLGEGLGMVALKRLDDAERDGDRIYAVIRGLGTSSDGRSKSVYAPVSAGQASAVSRAYGVAGYSPSTIELLEAHGTGTKAGDAAEFGGLELAFGDTSEERQWCALGTVKSQIGHTKAAAGAAGLFKAVMALHHKVLPPTIKVERPNPALELEQSPFYVNTETRPWIRSGSHPRRAGVSSFGFGGSNFHVAVEEYTGANRPPRTRTLPSELVLLSGATGADVASAARVLAERCDVTSLRRLAWESAQDWQPTAGARLAVVADDANELRGKLLKLASIIEAAPDVGFERPDGTAYGVGDLDGGVAFLFPGQGSQYVTMGASLAMSFDAARGPWDAAAEQSWDGLRLDEVVHPIPRFDDADRAADADRLRSTQWAQPGIGCTSLSLLAMMRSLGVKADAVAGHSFGELTALCAAGVLDEASFLAAARKRGEIMAAAAEVAGGMIAVSAPIEQVEAALVPGVVIASHNSPTQVVVSGPLEAIEAAEAAFGAAGLRAKRLQVATAFHSPVVAGGVEPFDAFLGGLTLADPALPVWSGELAAPYGAPMTEQQGVLARQIARPVHWTALVNKLADQGVRTFIEVGPGSVLSGLVGQILSERPHRAVMLDRKGKDGVTALLRGIGRLAAAGVSLDPQALWAGYGEPVDANKTKKPKLAVSLCGANHGKAYPPAGGAKDLPAPNPERAAVAPVISRPSAPSAKAPVATTPVAATVAPQVALPAALPVMAAAPSPMPLAQPAPAQTAPAGDHWIAAWEEAQRQNAQAHTAFQQAMTASHSAFLQTVESSFATLATLSGTPVAPKSAQLAELPPVRSAFAAPVAPKSGQLAELPPVRSVSAAPIAPKPAQLAELPPVRSVSAAPIAPKPAQLAELPPVQHTPAAPAVDLHALMLEVVSDKTGYPADMLDVSMDLEGDLGIDSIKRVEILAAVQDRAPGMPDVDAGHMGTLHTLGEIVEYMQGLMPAASATPKPAQLAELPPVPHTPAAPAIDLHALMLEVVADKTGYPADMLDVSMDLEGDLGIDSIKRVEILAAVQDRAPGMPDVDAGHMGTLHTLGEIVEYMQGLMPAANAPKPAQLAELPPVQHAPAVDLHALMLEVVADKTGYPADMLDVSMDLEGDLGIDSIKRVEILAAVQDRAPGMPDVDAGHMGTLHTLGEIVEYMQGLMPSSAAPRPAQLAELPPVPHTPAAPAVDLHALMLEVVAEKTGYPADMLDVSMDLEGDLGIDSIKRVEILAAVQDRAPGMPDVDAGHMGTLHTLGEIVTYMQGLMPSATPSPAQVAEVPAPATAVPPTPATPELSRYALTLEPTPAAGLAQPGLLGADEVIITSGGGGLALALAEELRTRGVPARAADVIPEDARAVVFLGGVRAVTTDEDAIAVAREGFHAARTIGLTLTAHGGLFVTVQDTGGRFGTTLTPGPRAYLGSLAALVKTASQEWPLASLKAIDIDRAGRADQALATALADELLLGGGDLEVGLDSSGARFATRSVEVLVPAGQPVIGAGDVVVVSGGARGVTAACVIAWAKQTPARFVLLGRSVLLDEPAVCQGIPDDAGLKRALLSAARAAGESLSPKDLSARVRGVLSAREIRATIAAITAAGAEARYVSASVTDAAALAQTFAAVRAEWGPIRGLVHGAGVLADRKIAEQTDAQFDMVWNTKVEGLRALLDATSTDPMALLCLFSSVSARCGNNGQAAYAMANEALNKVAQAEARRRPDMLVKSLGWGPWRGGMVGPQLEAHFASLGVPMIPLDVGARMFVEEMASTREQVELVLGGEPRPEALLVEGNEERRLELEVAVGAASHPWLRGHRISETVVVPVVLVAEWFVRMARAFRPDLTLDALQDVSVVRGIKLKEFEDRPERFVLSCRQLSNGHGAQLAVELHDTAGTLLYRARASMAASTGATPAARPSHPAPLLDDWGGAAIYGDVLFHSDDFRVIRELDGVGPDGISGTLAGVHEAGWSWEDWHTDVAALDGGLQLVLLWARTHLGGAALPMGISELRVDGPLADGPVRCVARCSGRGAQRAKADVVFMDSTGRRVAELRGVELVLRPDKAAVGARA